MCGSHWVVSLSSIRPRKITIGPLTSLLTLKAKYSLNIEKCIFSQPNYRSRAASMSKKTKTIYEATILLIRASRQWDIWVFRTLTILGSLSCIENWCSEARRSCWYQARSLLRPAHHTGRHWWGPVQLKTSVMWSRRPRAALMTQGC